MAETKDSGEWLDVPCPDGSRVSILKDSNDAFTKYAQDWTKEVNNTVDLLERTGKEEKNSDVDNNKIENIVGSIRDIDNDFRELYMESYSTFAARPCDTELRKLRDDMEIAINSAATYLERIQEHFRGKKDQINSMISF